MKKLVGQGKPFHSALDKAAGLLKRKVGTGAEFMNELKGLGGIKQAEIDERKLGEIMGMPKMTHEQFLSALQNRPAPAIQEKVLGEPMDAPTFRKEINNFVRTQARRYASNNSDTSREYRILAGDEMRRLRNNPEVPPYVASVVEQDDEPYHGQWTLPGGDNYREMLIKAPKGAEQFSGVQNHFGGEPNILASMRLKDRTGPNGEKLLHLEELQSDWHQEGRKKGYKDSNPEAKAEQFKELKKAYDELNKRRWELHEQAKQEPDAGPRFDSLMEEANSITPKLLELNSQMHNLEHFERQQRDAVPNAPFKSNWEEMALKRLIHHAAEKGYHGIVVTPGQEQADRYDLSKHINKIDVGMDPSGEYSIIAEDKNGRELMNQLVPANKLSDHVGKEMAEKIVSQVKSPNEVPTTFSGLDLQVGGEGMKGFYDKKVPNILNSIGKKYGVKTGVMHVPMPPKDSTKVLGYPGGEEYVQGRTNWNEFLKQSPHAAQEIGTHLHHFPITEEMRKDVLTNGLPLYAEGGVIHKAEGGNVQPTIAQMKAALSRGNPLNIQSIGAYEAPDMNPKTYLPPDSQTEHPTPPGGVATPSGLPIGGADMNAQMPGQQLMPQNMAQPQPQAPQGGQQPMQQPPSNILSITRPGRALNALQPQAPQGMADGGSMHEKTSRLKQMLKQKFSPEAIKASEALGKHEGKTLHVTQSDRTKVGGGFLGGPGFSSLQHVDPEYKDVVWGVNSPGAASRILNVSAEHPEGSALWSTMIGAPTQHSSNQMVFNMLLKEFKKGIKAGKLKPETRAAINQILATSVDDKGNPIFGKRTDISGKNFFEHLDTFDKRRIMADLMGGIRVGGKKGQVFDYDKIIQATTEPELLGAPTHAIGPRLFTTTGDKSYRPELHPAFPHMVHGEDLGVMYHPVPKEVMLPEFHEKIQKEKGRNVGYMDLTRNVPSQFLSEEFLTKLQKQGHKKGGKVNMDAMRLELTKKKGK